MKNDPRFTAWQPISEERADLLLCSMPPIYFKGGFFNSETYSHKGNTPLYLAVTQHKGQYFERIESEAGIKSALGELP
jgi:hypothetical protein